MQSSRHIFFKLGKMSSRREFDHLSSIVDAYTFGQVTLCGNLYNSNWPAPCPFCLLPSEIVLGSLWRPSLWTPGWSARRAILQAVECHFLQLGLLTQLSRVWRQETRRWRLQFDMRQSGLTRPLEECAGRYDEGEEIPATWLYSFDRVDRVVLWTPDELNASLEAAGGF